MQALNAETIRPNVVRTDAGEATLEDIEQGLTVAIEENYTPSDDPIVFAVRQAITMARNGLPLRTAAHQLQIDMAVLTSLAELGIEANVEDAADEVPESQPLNIQVEVEDLI